MVLSLALLITLIALIFALPHWVLYVPAVIVLLELLLTVLPGAAFWHRRQAPPQG